MHTIKDIAAGANPSASLKRRIADVSDEMLDDVKHKIKRKIAGQSGGLKKLYAKKKPKAKYLLKKKCIDVFVI